MSVQLKASLRTGDLRKIRRGEVLGRYSDAPWGTRFFLALRWFWTPYEEMACLLPVSGKILDGGSGHGLFSITLALQSPARKVKGIDHSSPRIGMAQKAAQGLENLSFTRGDFGGFGKNRYDGLAFVDVLHYLPYEAQGELIKEAFRRLRPGGILLFRDVDRKPGLASFWNRFHETLMTAMGFTQAEELHFRSSREWEDLARRAGFQTRSKPTGRFPFADVLFWCRKPSPAFSTRGLTKKAKVPY